MSNMNQFAHCNYDKNHVLSRMKNGYFTLQLGLNIDLTKNSKWSLCGGSFEFFLLKTIHKTSSRRRLLFTMLSTIKKPTSSRGGKLLWKIILTN